MQLAFFDGNKQCRSETTGQGSFHTHYWVRVSIIVGDPTVTVKWTTAIKKSVDLYFNMYLSVMWIVFHVQLHPYPFLLISSFHFHFLSQYITTVFQCRVIFTTVYY